MITIQDRIDVLEQRHHEVDVKLAISEKQLANGLQITMLKKQKLRIKDEIARLSKNLETGENK